MTKSEFLAQECDSNEIWVAQQIALFLSNKTQLDLIRSLKILNDLLYKSWAKDIKIETLIETLETTSKLK